MLKTVGIPCVHGRGVPLYRISIGDHGQLPGVQASLPLHDLKSIHLCQLFEGGGLSMVEVSLSIGYPSVTMDSPGAAYQHGTDF